jgi:hypothetical protein
MQDFTSDSQILVSIHGSHISQMKNFTIKNIEKYTCGNNSQETLNIMVKHIPFNQQLEKNNDGERKFL